MGSRIRAFVEEVGAKLRSPTWWLGIGVVFVWWLVESRFDLATKANEILDKWAFPVIPDLLGALLLPSVIIVGLLVALLLHAYWVSHKAQTAAGGDTMHAVGAVSSTPPEDGTSAVDRISSQLEQLEAAFVNPIGPSAGQRYTRSELIEREEYRNYVTQQIGVAADIRHELSQMGMRGFLPVNKAREAKWVADTYYGLRDRNFAHADYFGHPGESASLDDRVRRLHTVLDAM